MHKRYNSRKCGMKISMKLWYFDLMVESLKRCVYLMIRMDFFWHFIVITICIAVETETERDVFPVRQL